MNEQKLRSDGFFDATLIRQRWDEHIKGTRNWQSALWNVLMFQAWLENQSPENEPLSGFKSRQRF